jgi:hypothetical protein
MEGFSQREEVLEALESRNYGNNIQRPLNDISALLENNAQTSLRRYSFSVFFNAALVSDLKNFLFKSRVKLEFMEFSPPSNDGTSPI